MPSISRWSETNVQCTRVYWIPLRHDFLPRASPRMNQEKAPRLQTAEKCDEYEGFCFFSFLQMATKDETVRMTQWDENLIKNLTTKMWFVFFCLFFLQILITGLHGCRNYSYLNGGIRSDKCFKRTTARRRDHKGWGVAKKIQKC